MPRDPRRRYAIERIDPHPHAGENILNGPDPQHNVSVMNRLMREVRAAIRAGTLDSLEKEWLV